MTARLTPAVIALNTEALRRMAMPYERRLSFRCLCSIRHRLQSLWRRLQIRKFPRTANQKIVARAAAPCSALSLKIVLNLFGNRRQRREMAKNILQKRI